MYDKWLIKTTGSVRPIAAKWTVKVRFRNLTRYYNMPQAMVPGAVEKLKKWLETAQEEYTIETNKGV